MPERGATEAEIVDAVVAGESYPVKFGRMGFRKTFSYMRSGVDACTLTKKSKRSQWRYRTAGSCLRQSADIFEDYMKLSYDRDNNIAYLRLRPPGKEIETIRVSDELNVDLAPDGSVYGIELLNANEQLRGSDGGKLVLVDERDGREVELSLEAR